MIVPIVNVSLLLLGIRGDSTGVCNYWAEQNVIDRQLKRTSAEAILGQRAVLFEYFGRPPRDNAHPQVNSRHCAEARQGRQHTVKINRILITQHFRCAWWRQVLLPMLLNVVFDPACQEGGATANSMLLAAGDYRCLQLWVRSCMGT